MDTIGLIAAMPQESNALIRYIKGWKRSKLGKLDCKSFVLFEHNCLLVTSGIGTRRASEAAKALIEAREPGLLISYGIAGGVEANLGIGDVVVPEAYCKLENGAPGPLVSLSQWPETALEAAAYLVGKRGKRLVSGTAVTTGNSNIAEGQLRDMKHPVLEMETAGIARVAAEKGIPLLCMRAISDGPSAPIPFKLSMMMDDEANIQSGRILIEMVRHPKILFQIRRLMRNSKIAADMVAEALIEALGSGEI